MHAAKPQQMLGNCKWKVKKSLKCWHLQCVGCPDNQPLSAAVESQSTMWSHALPAQLNCCDKLQAAAYSFFPPCEKNLITPVLFIKDYCIDRNYPIFYSKFLMRERERMTILGIFLFLYKTVSSEIFTDHLTNLTPNGQSHWGSWGMTREMSWDLRFFCQLNIFPSLQSKMSLSYFHTFFSNGFLLFLLFLVLSFNLGLPYIPQDVVKSWKSKNVI